MRRPLALSLALLAAGCGARSDLEASTAPGPAGSCILFGGYPSSSSSASEETWLWSGSAWASPPTTLSGIGFGASTTFEGQVVLFTSGDTTAAASTDTWVWSGTSWDPRMPPLTPPARILPAVAARGGEVVLFGGASADGAVTIQSDTWLWNGSTWTEAHPAHVPPARWRASMATLGDEVVLFGGATGQAVLGDTWVWDGADWSERQPANAPSARSGAVAATVAGRILLFGGCAGGGYEGCAEIGADVAETWAWDGDTWSQLAPATSPPARDGAAFATLGTRAVLFGGFVAGEATSIGDTWIWSGDTWTPSQAQGPSARGLPAMSCW